MAAPRGHVLTPPKFGGGTAHARPSPALPTRRSLLRPSPTPPSPHGPHLVATMMWEAPFPPPLPPTQALGPYPCGAVGPPAGLAALAALPAGLLLLFLGAPLVAPAAAVATRVAAGRGIAAAGGGWAAVGAGGVAAAAAVGGPTWQHGQRR